MRSDRQYIGGKFHTNTFFCTSNSFCFISSVAFDFDYTTYCKRSDTQLYTPRQGQPIRRIFNRFGVKSIWTTIFKQDAALIDGDGFPLELETDLETIGLSKLALTEMTDSKHRAVLTRMDMTDLTDTPFQLERKIFSDKASVICVQNLSFPFRSTDVDHIKKFIKQMTIRLDTHQENIRRPF